MSQTVPASTIESLSDVTGSTSNTLFKEIFCFGLSINISSSGPSRLLVTDFSSNPLISNSFRGSYFIEEFEIPVEQIFQIDLYQEKLNVLIKEYELNFRDSLFDASPAPPFRISDKVCILKASVVLKKYNNVLEGRARKVRLVNNGDLGDDNLKKLFSRLSKLPASFFNDNMDKIKKVIPNIYYEKALSDLKDQGSSQTKRTVNGALSGSNLPSQNQGSQAYSSQATQFPIKRENVTNIISESQPGQGSIKCEEISETVVPDTLFAEDYFNSDDENLPEFGNSQPPQVSQNILNIPQGYHSIKQLNESFSNSIDNEIYRIKAKVIGSNPDDLSYICVKTYKHQMRDNKILLSDPFMRSLELIICDQSTRSGNEDVILLEMDNFMTIYLDGEQLLKSFDFDSIESAYTKLPQLIDKSFKSSFVELELFKKFVKINDGDQLLVWSARNLVISDLIG